LLSQEPAADRGKMKGYLMPARFTYRRLTAEEFNAELDRQSMTIPSFARIFGVNLKTAEKWAAAGDIPPWVPIAMTLLTPEGSLGLARMAAARFIERDNLRPELGDFPYLALRELPADAESGE
jgi:hypothetical protein